MIPIPGRAAAFITFPGVVLHEISHRFMCDILNIKVYKVKYFCLKNRDGIVGFVQHEPVNDLSSNILIGFAPLIINTIFCMILTFPFNFSYALTGEYMPNIYNSILLYIGMSCGFNAIPSDQDMENIINHSDEESSGVVLAAEFIMGVNNVAFLNFFYASTISMTLPLIVAYFL